MNQISDNNYYLRPGLLNQDRRMVELGLCDNVYTFEFFVHAVYEL